MTRPPIKRRPLLQQVKDAVAPFLPKPRSDVERQFGPPGRYIPPVAAGGNVKGRPSRETVRGAAQHGTLESGRESVEKYIEATQSETYRKASPRAQRKFRKQSEADLIQFKDVI